jgi:two-component system sensor histidine kinase DctS
VVIRNADNRWRADASDTIRPMDRTDLTPANPPLPGSRRLRWLLTMPKLGIGLLIVAMIALLVALHNAEIEEQRETLIGDVLWLEQNLRFQLATSSDKLQQMATGMSSGAETRGPDFAVQANAILKQHPEIGQVIRLDPQHRIVAARPSGVYPRIELEPFGQAPLQEYLSRARQLGRPIYTPFFTNGTGEHGFEIVIPIFNDQQYEGTVVAVYSLRKLMDGFVPWWFAEKYRLQMIDDNDTEVIISKSNISGPAFISYDLPFDGLGERLILRASAFKPAFNTAQRFFAVAIVVLALIVLASLLAIRRQLLGRLAAEQALRQSNAFRKAMEDSLLTGLRARDLDGKLIYANPAFCRMVGFSANEMIGLTAPMPYWAPEVMEETMRMHEAVMLGHAPPEGYEIKLRRKSGELFDALIYEAPLIDGEGQQVGWMGSVVDITERKRDEELQRQQQEQLQHTARLVALGEMASSLAHELNQPLGAISSYASGCINKIEAGRAAIPELGEILGKISAQSQRAGKIIRQVHDFVRKRTPRRELCSVAEVVDDAVTLFEPQARKAKVRIQRTIQGGLPDVMGDPTMIEQVLINLFRNASDAMEAVPESDRVVEVNVAGLPGFVEVRVADHGPGISPEKADLLFAPFYTTKPEGLGMGLPICRSIVEFHHGRLSVGSRPGGGAAFTFTLPVEST